MNYSAVYRIAAGLALSAMLLPATALAEKRTPFSATEKDTDQNFDVFPGTDGKWYVFDGTAKFVMESDEPRVAGLGSYSMYAIMGGEATTVWGELHIENTDKDGFWDGYWTGTEDGFIATCVGSGKFAGLVSRWSAPPSLDRGIYDWEGYIVENGPGDVDFKISGWRQEQSMPPITSPAVMPFYVVAPLAEGGGKASHLGVFTDLEKTGLVRFTSPPTPTTPPNAIFCGTGILKAANGDLLKWVTFGKMLSGKLEVTGVYFAGGTGRFEHAVGSFVGPLQGESPTVYTYTGTGKIRY
jgi:hypothetical protein